MLRLATSWLAVLLSSPLSSLAEPPRVITVAADRALEPATGAVHRNVVVRIAEGRIVALADREDGEVVDHDLGDVTLLPGLIDCHVHLIGSQESTPYGDLTQTAARAAIEGVANARRTLEAGFTTARDLGSRDFADAALRDAIAEGSVPGPRLLVAIKSLSSTGGHGDRNELPADIHVERYAAIADGAEAIRAKVRENVKYGADWIKVLATGGVMSAGTDPRAAHYTEEELRAAVAAAAERGKDVAAHAHGTEGIKRAVRAGVRSIEHASMLDEEAIRLVAEHGTFLVPNPITNATMLDRGTAGGFQPFQLEKARFIYGLKMESLRKAIRAGLPIAYGTDSGVQAHGDNGRQLALFVEAGMTPLAALQSATTVAARLLRMEGRIGTLAPGAYADLVAVAGDPLQDVRTVERPLWVMKEGRVEVDRRPR
ncbi:MAG TPA: amidohydrolase family protein [Thermoanaerobaculia bacterium]|nr:amidohydrolase family protein [Thermoanaerobaculia bacterium]